MKQLKTVNYLYVYADGSMDLLIDDFEDVPYPIAYVGIDQQNGLHGGGVISFTEFSEINEVAWNDERTRIYVFEEWN